MKGDLHLALQFMQEHPTEAARILEVLPLDETTELMRATPGRVAGPVLGAMSPTVLVGLLEREPQHLGTALTHISKSRTVVALLRRLQPESRREFLASIDRDQAARLETQLRFNEDQIGALVNPHCTVLSGARSVREALKQIRRHPPPPGYHVYISNENGTLIGYLPWPALLGALPGQRLGGLAKNDIARLNAQDPVTLLRDHGDWRRFPELPVTTRNGNLIGVVDYATFREIEVGHSPIASSSEAAARALGELYEIGLSAFLRGTATALTDKDGKP